MMEDMEKIKFLSDEEVKECSFFELAYYLDVLNDLERVYKSSVAIADKNVKFKFFMGGISRDGK